MAGHRSVDRRIAGVAARQYGVFSRAQATRAGATRSMILERIRSGRWTRIHRGVFMLNGAPDTWSARVLGACLATGGFAARRTAGAVWELPVCMPDVPEVVVPRPRDPRHDGIVVYRATELGRDDVTRRGPIPVTRPPYTILTLAVDLDPGALEEAVEDAIRRRLVTPARLRQRLEAASRTHPRVGVLRDILDRRGDQSPTESGLETELIQLVREAGGPELVRQHRVRLPSGPVRLDLACVEVKVYVEVDGWAWHSSRTRADRDKERQNELAELGWLPLRFTSTHIRLQGAASAQRLIRTLRARGYRW